MQEYEVNLVDENDREEGTRRAINIDLQWFAEDGATAVAEGTDTATEDGSESYIGIGGTDGDGETTTEETAAETGDGEVTETPKKPGWTAGLKADLREHADLVGFQTVSDLANQFLKLKGESGGLKVPGKEATDEEKAAFRKAIGVPESADGYQLKYLEGNKEDKAFEGWFKKTAYESGLTASQAAAQFKAIQERNLAAQKAIAAAKEKQQEEFVRQLKEEHGDKLSGKLKKANAYAKKLFDQKFMKFLDSSGLGKHPEFINAVIRLSEAVSEDSIGDPLSPGKRRETSSWGPDQDE